MQGETEETEVAYDALRECDPFRSYLREIVGTALLTPKQEIALADRIAAGDAAAREHLILAHLRLVVNLARKYEHCGLPLLDLISEGNIGLMIAADRFHSRFGARFSTYATWWIKQKMKRALDDQGRTIRVPVHMQSAMFQMRRESEELFTKLGREPTDEELVQALGVSDGKVERMREASMRTLSLDAQMGDSEDSATLLERLAAPEEKSNEEFDLCDKSVGGRKLCDLVATLNSRQRLVLVMRFGLNGAAPKTLEDVAAILGVTRERVRQLEFKALKKLRERATSSAPFEMERAE